MRMYVVWIADVSNYVGGLSLCISPSCKRP